MGLVQPVEVRASEGYRIWLRYDDGVEGEVDLSHMLESELFQIWRDRAVFESVYIDGRDISWGEDLEFCPDALYMEITGKTYEEMFPNPRPLAEYA